MVAAASRGGGNGEGFCLGLCTGLSPFHLRLTLSSAYHSPYRAGWLTIVGLKCNCLEAGLSLSPPTLTNLRPQTYYLIFTTPCSCPS